MTDAALLILRSWLGLVMLVHGSNHLRSLEGTAKWFGSIGFKQARLNAIASGFGEVTIGLGLILGLFTSVAVTGLVTVMTIAFIAVHRKAGFFVFNRPDEGWEFVATLAVSGLVLAILGPGRWSIDSALGIDLTGWWGVAFALGGAVLAGVMLGAFWRPSSDH
ncbi:MAG: DoxX family membrane protein [Acidimicrobiia bacterium]|nr:DoxX family membrane protein [Acidimicrobiia bacterium]